MNRKPAPGSLEAAAYSMAQDISRHPDDWEKRRDALVSMQRAVDQVATSGQGGSSVFTADMWRSLKEPLKHTLNDLRSAIVKEACTLLEKLSTAAGNSMAALLRDILNVLLQLLANGNSVIVAQVDMCMRHVIKHTRFLRQLKEVEYTVRNSRSKDLREMVASYVYLILDTWPPASMEKEIAFVESLVSMQLADASSAARTDARASFGLFQQHWPRRAGKILEGADSRTAKTLREEYGSEEGSARAASVKESPARLARSVPRLLKATETVSMRGRGGRGFGASRLGLKKASMSDNSLKCGEADRVNGHDNGNGEPLASPAHSSASKTGRGVGMSPATAARPAAPSPSGTTVAATKKRTGPGSPVTANLLSSSRTPSTVGAGTKRRPPHAADRGITSPTSPSAPGSLSSMRRKPRTLMNTPPGSSLSRAGSRTGTAGYSTHLPGGSGVKARSPMAAVPSPLLVSPDGFLAGGGNIQSPETTSRGGGGGGGGGGGSLDGTSVAGSVSMSDIGMAALVPGDKVRLKGCSPRSAVVRYIGETQFASGIWVGVELSPSEKRPGNNNGSVNGVPYFRCPPERGIFLRPNMVETEDFMNEVVPGAGVENREPVPERGRGDAGPVDGAESPESEAEAKRAGNYLLRCHKLFMEEAMNSLKDEVGVIPELESAVESGQAVPAERLRFYLEMLESAAVAREAAASRLRAEIRDAALRYPGIFETPAATDSMSELLCPDYDHLGDSDGAADKDDSEEVREQGETCNVARGKETERQADDEIGGNEDAGDATDGTDGGDGADGGNAAGIVDAGGNGGDPAGAREEETTSDKDEGGGGLVTAADGEDGLETYMTMAPSAFVPADSRHESGVGGNEETVADGGGSSVGAGVAGVKTYAADVAVEAT